MKRSKLLRNLKPGDKIRLTDLSDEKPRTHVLTVRSVQETQSGHMTGKRRWEVHGDYPWWWAFPVVGYSKDRVELVT